ncbi:universal stress protein [Catellatospora coxensis]|uniref:universal stress protein n=1 Tax=Catellatospora coxensis TaxID=310354 RepID=UPI0031E3CDC8
MDTDPPLSASPEELAAQALLDAAIAGARRHHPHVPVIQRLIRTGAVGTTLMHQSAEAGLVVVGSRGHAGAAGLLLGSVSQVLLHHAGCPVIVIR